MYVWRSFRDFELSRISYITVATFSATTFIVGKCFKNKLYNFVVCLDFMVEISREFNYV